MIFTAFNGVSASEAKRITVTWDDLCKRLASPREVASKSECTLISLSLFGDKRTERGSLRSGENVLECWGCELDYDGETMHPREASDALEAAGITHFIYTSPSHKPDAPRWRALIPFTTAADPAERRVQVEKCNHILGGVLSNESFTLSQPFYCGKVAGVPYETFRYDGGDVRLMDIPRMPWRGSNADEAGGSFTTSDAFVGMIEAGVEIHPSIVALAWRGWSAEDIADVVMRSELRNTRPDRWQTALDEDIPRAIESAQGKRLREIEKRLARMDIPPPPAPVLKPPSDFESLWELTSVFRPITWLIRDRIEHPTLITLFGPPESGKSLAAIDMACCVALGRPWRGHNTKRSRVYYFAGEGHNGLGRRFLAWKIHNNVSDADWRGADLHVSKHAINMTDDESLVRLWDEFAARGAPDLLFIDTYTRMTPGLDHNSQKEVSRFVRLLDDIKKTYGCTVIVIAHTGQADQSRAMGSIVLKGATDVEIGAKKYDDGSGLELSNTKSKESARWPDMHFKFLEVALPWLENPDAGPEESPRPQHSAVLVDAPAPEPKAAGRKDESIQVFRDILREANLPETILKKRFYELYPTGQRAAQKNFAGALKRALDNGLISYDEDNGLYRLTFT